MYLKSIEIQGFKSFANKILFEFHNGITGIVGPNGSGKSNVADAVRWVLGEQRSKQLRGGTMQDVIFAGTELRKPQGFAYVAITFDNSDHKLPIEYDEVTVSRRLYRSGESEYKINGTGCRLKDINELFFDTGIGKEGYSIIGQGQIDRILSGRPEERRELFDEAAGIVKFKRRKAIAQKKLEDEKQNLIRVTDILSELEKQVGPLKKQSEEAKEYLRLREELRCLDANLFLSESEELKSQIREIEKKENILTDDQENVRTESDKLKSEYETLGAEIDALDAAIDEEKNAGSRADLERQEKAGRIDVLREQIRTEQMNEEHIRSRMSSIDDELFKKEKEKSAYEDEKKTLEEALQEVEKEHSDTEAIVRNMDESVRNTEESIEKAKAEIIDILNQKADLAARRQRHETMLEQADVRRAQATQKLLKFKSDESVQEEQKKEESKKLEEVKEQLKELLRQEKELSDKIHTFEEDERKLNQKLSSLQQDYHTSRTKLESMKNLAERYEGYGGSIRRVMEVKDRITGIHGVVADIITTTKKYEVAIETALGGSIQNIVTDSENTAKRLIEHLKKNRYGRATFLPLTSMERRQNFGQPEALKEEGVVGLASDLVSADEKYSGLVSYLLGRVVVADQIDHAIALAKKYRYSLRIVTLDGELLSPGGSMTGGAFKNNSNLLGRRREIEELQNACKKTLQQIDEVQKELAGTGQGLAKVKKSLSSIQETRQKNQIQQNTLELIINQLESRRQEIEDSAKNLTFENQELELQVLDLRGLLEKLKSDEIKLEEFDAEKNHYVNDQQMTLESLKKQREEAVSVLSAKQLKSSQLEQKNSFVEENLQRISEEKQRLLTEKETLTNGHTDSSETIAARESEIKSLEIEIKEASDRRSKMEAAIQNKLCEKEEKTARQKKFFDKKEELDERLKLLDRDGFRLQNQKERLNERLESLVDYMWSEYEITYSRAEELKKEEFSSISDMKKSINEKKMEIRALGNVNVNAIDDYKEISERYEFMKNQHEDLVAAEATLEKIIEELDEGMRRQFKEKFGEICLEFNKVFKELFGGGTGTLELSQDEDILEAGIQIISQPPGKKLQNMMQLSGGEKALTAIALLFAIQNLKPSPFCLLDEIEAALDDSNVDRFAGYLHKLTRYTQFIVITHRRGTMVAADRLYGITMQEKGVSALVSVNLIEAQMEREERVTAG